uniref:Glycine-rich nucleic acid binding protein n=1 Tax=Gymnochlora stellata TaxID=67809 RepID=B5A4M3_GYMST|nr:glycine-rich nucleic acid binding protein [Gymnochlora stellata]
MHSRGRGHGAGRRGRGVRRLPDRQSGTCKWFNTVKGYGFILPQEGKDDIFVHQTAIKAVGFRSLAEGEQVEFDVEVDATGRKKARNVTGPNGAYVRGAPFVHPYVRRGSYVHRCYARGGWGRAGSADDMHVYGSGGYPRFRGRGGGRGAGRVEYAGGGSHQSEAQFQGRYSFPSAYPYSEYSAAGYPVYGSFSGGQQNMYMPAQTMQQGRGGTNMLSQQMQGMSLQPQMGMRPTMGTSVPQMASPQQMFGYPPTIMTPSSGNDGGRSSSARGRGGHSNSQTKGKSKEQKK